MNSLTLMAALLLAAKGPLLPRKPKPPEVRMGHKLSFSLQQLEKRAQVFAKGPSVLLCVARRSDDHGVRVELELPSVTQETINLILVRAGQATVDLPKGVNVVDLSAWSANGASGTAVLSLHPPGYVPTPLPPDLPPQGPASMPAALEHAPPAKVTQPPPSKVTQPPDVTLPADVTLLSKLARETVDDEMYWKLTRTSPATFRVTSAQALVFDVRRHPSGHDREPTRVLVVRNGQTVMSALFAGDGDAETLQVDVPPGAHVVTLKTTDPRGLLMRIRARR
jgi:hypothetical protein